MSKLLRWVGVGFGALFSIVLVLVMALYGYSSYRFNKTYSFSDPKLTIKTDPATLARGRYLTTVVAKCVDCHTPDLGGKVFIEDAALGKVVTPNLTMGKGGVAATYTDEDWVRLMRHGVKPDGKPALFMPATETTHLTDADTAAIIAYIRSAKPVDREHPPTAIGPLGRGLYLAGKLPLVATEDIDHAMPHLAALPVTADAHYGEYIAKVGGCIGCHGPGLSGGPIPGTPPDDPKFPPATNLTPDGAFGKWSEAQFMQSMRTGMRPDGSTINEFMPWKLVGQMTDDELKAVYRYLKTVPGKADGTGHASL